VSYGGGVAYELRRPLSASCLHPTRSPTPLSREAPLPAPRRSARPVAPPLPGSSTPRPNRPATTHRAPSPPWHNR